MESINDIAQNSDIIDMDICEAAETDNPPITLDLPKVARPFELVTELFGMPKYNEIDPTPALTPFFMLFFATCIADLGYAILAPLIAWVILRMMTGGRGGGGKRIYQVILYSMPMGIIMGFLTGGFFGISMRDVEFLKPVYAALGPVSTVMDINGDYFFVVTLAIGSVQIIVGRLLAFFYKLKMKDVASAWFDEFSWLLISISFPFFMIIEFLKIIDPAEVPSWFFFTFTLGKSAITMLVTDPVLIFGLLIIVLFKGRENKNIAGRLFGGLYGAYDITGLLGDILSYSRLLALGLGSGAIASVINQMGGIINNVDGIGMKILIGVIVVVALVVAHLVNLLLAMMSGFVHSLRLEFVEFFSKFYEGGGSKYTPFENKYEYVYMQESTAKK